MRALPSPGGRSPIVGVAHAIPGRVRLRVPDLRLQPSMAAALEGALLALPGVTAVRIAAGAASVIVDHVPGALDAKALARSAAAAPIVVLPPSAARTPAQPARGAAEDGGSKRALYLSSAGLLAALVVGPAAGYAVYPMIFYTSLPIFERTWRSLVHRRKLNVDLLDSLSVLAAVATRDLLNASGIVWLICLGDFVRDLTQARARRAIRDLLEYQNDTAWVVRGDKKVRVPVRELAVGDVVIIYTGSLIPVDGTVVDGEATVDQQALTGESVPVVRGPDDHCLAATIVQEGKLYVRAERVGDDTKAARTVRLIEEAPVHETRAQNYAEHVADRLVGPSLVCSAAVFLATRDVYRLAALLTVDFGTGPRVSAPTTVLAAMAAAARHGVLIRGGAHLEKLAKLTTVVFDKTGTLTRGAPEVEEVIVHADLPEDDVVALAAAASARHTHPVSAAVTRLAEARGVAVPDRSDSRYRVGRGVLAIVGERAVALGSARLMEEEGVAVGLDPALGARITADGRSFLFLAVGGAHAATLIYRDALRPESAELIKGLRARGVSNIVMLTGDGVLAARRVARDLGIERVHAEMLPEDKVRVARSLERPGEVVAVIGDGINDSPALSYADVGISFSAGAEIAREAAGVVLMEDNLLKLLDAIDLSRRAMDVIRQNNAITFGMNAVAYALAIPGIMSPVRSTLVSNGSAVLACINGLRLLLGPAKAPPERGVA